MANARHIPRNHPVYTVQVWSDVTLEGLPDPVLRWLMSEVIEETWLHYQWQAPSYLWLPDNGLDGIPAGIMALRASSFMEHPIIEDKVTEARNLLFHIYDSDEEIDEESPEAYAERRAIFDYYEGLLDEYPTSAARRSTILSEAAIHLAAEIFSLSHSMEGQRRRISSITLKWRIDGTIDNLFDHHKLLAPDDASYTNRHDTIGALFLQTLRWICDTWNTGGVRALEAVWNGQTILARGDYRIPNPGTY